MKQKTLKINTIYQYTSKDNKDKVYLKIIVKDKQNFQLKLLKEFRGNNIGTTIDIEIDKDKQSKFIERFKEITEKQLLLELI
ncbi:MAG: hypothetical protein KKB31_04225 [Nanoarchaeota archaeon]|nr:hypothetical protein [Nanoarchaeota archaeon]